MNSPSPVLPSFPATPLRDHRPTAAGSLTSDPCELGRPPLAEPTAIERSPLPPSPRPAATGAHTIDGAELVQGRGSTLSRTAFGVGGGCARARGQVSRNFPFDRPSQRTAVAPCGVAG